MSEHIIFEAWDGLRYDTSIHDYIEQDGALASAQRVSDVMKEDTVEEVEQARRERWGGSLTPPFPRKDEQP